MILLLNFCITNSETKETTVAHGNVIWENGYPLFVGMQWKELAIVFTIDQIRFIADKDEFYVEMKEMLFANTYYQAFIEHCKKKGWL
jgi:hypothetical protein